MNADITITSAAIATLISAITSASVTLWITSTNKRKALDDQLDGILKIAIQYPYLESDDFTASWKSDFNRNDERYLRYDMYCTLLFNFICRLAKHYKYDQEKMEDFVTVKDWVRHHGKYWVDPTAPYENIDSYNKKFVSLINSYLK